MENCSSSLSIKSFFCQSWFVVRCHKGEIGFGTCKVCICCPLSLHPSNICSATQGLFVVHPLTWLTNLCLGLLFAVAHLPELCGCAYLYRVPGAKSQSAQRSCHLCNVLCISPPLYIFEREAAVPLPLAPMKRCGMSVYLWMWHILPVCHLYFVTFVNHTDETCASPAGISTKLCRVFKFPSICQLLPARVTCSYLSLVTFVYLRGGKLLWPF